MDKKLPELIYCRNITYKDALQGELAQKKRMLHQATITQEMARDRIKIVKAEIKRWRNYAES